MSTGFAWSERRIAKAAGLWRRAPAWAVAQAVGNGCTPEAVRALALAEGWGPGFVRASALTPEMIAQAKRLYVEDGLSTSEVAESLGAPWTQHRVRGLVQKQGWTALRGPEAAKRAEVQRSRAAGEGNKARPLALRQAVAAQAAKVRWEVWRAAQIDKGAAKPRRDVVASAPPSGRVVRDRRPAAPLPTHKAEVTRSDRDLIEAAIASGKVTRLPSGPAGGLSALERYFWAPGPSNDGKRWGQRSSKHRLLDWVEEQVQLDATSSWILYGLAQYADADGVAWAKVETLAKKARCSVRTCQYRLKELQEGGYLRLTGTFYRLGTRKVPYYRVGPVMAESEPEKAAKPAVSMGANPAPMEGCGTPDLHPYGCNCLHPHNEPKRTNSSADALETCGREVDFFEKAWPIYPEAGRLGVSSERKARMAWDAEVLAGGDPAKMLAGVVAYAANPSTWGASGRPKAMHNFLTDGCWADFEAMPPAANGVRGGFDGPEEVRAVIAREIGEGQARSYIDPATWDGEARALIAHGRIAFDWLTKNAASHLAGLGVRVLAPPG